MGPRKSKKTAPKSKRSEEAAADSNPKKKAKSEPAPAAREPDVHKMKWDHLWKEFAEADNPGEMTLEGFADLLEKADIDCTSAPALVLCWKLDFKLRNSSQVVQHDDYSGYFRFDRETVGGLKRQLETSRFDAASLDIDEFRCECARARAPNATRAHTHARDRASSVASSPRSEFYRFAFQFQRQSTKKGVERDLLVEVIPLVFPEHATGAASERGAFATQFVAFLKDVRKSRAARRSSRHFARARAPRPAARGRRAREPHLRRVDAVPRVLPDARARPAVQGVRRGRRVAAAHRRFRRLHPARRQGEEVGPLRAPLGDVRSCVESRAYDRHRTSPSCGSGDLWRA